MTVFTVTGADLAAATAWASRVIPTRPVAPVLAGLLLDAADDLTVSAYDYDTAVTTRIPATVTVPGRVLLSGRLLADIARTVRSDRNITVTVDGGAATVREGRSEWLLPLLPLDDYPALPDLGDPVGAVGADVLRRAVARVAPAAGRDDTLPMLTGVKLESDGDRLALAATDRFRIACATIGWSPVGDGLDVLVPAGLLEQAVKAADPTDRVSIFHGPGGLGFATDTHKVVGRLLDAQYPRWRQLLLTTEGRSAVVEVADLARAAEQATVAGGRAPQLVLAFGPGGVEVSAGSDDAARARTHAEVAAFEGDPITVGVNPAYLKDALAGVGGERVRIVFGANPNRPVLFTADTDGDGDDYRHLLMPVRIAGQVAA